jgi:hypothetical protein
MEYLKELLDEYSVKGAVAEIGTDAGEGSTKVLFNHVRDKGGAFYAIDIFPDEQKYDKVKKQLHLPNTHALRAYSVDAAKSWDKKLDFLFIDGDHNFPHLTPDGRQTGVVVDILAWHPHIQKNGILAFHDYYGSDTHYGKVELLGVEYAVDAFCHVPAYRWIGRKGTIMAFQKAGDHLLVPQFRPKIVPAEYRSIWQTLSRMATDIETIVIYGTATSAKYVYDAVCLRWPQKPQILFTDSFVQEEGVLFGGNRVLPFEQAKSLKALWVIGSLFEEEIVKNLHANQKRHLQDYFKLFEFVGWCHMEPFCRVETTG